jgi:hypothetical protein
MGTSIYWGYFIVSSQEVSTMALAISSMDTIPIKSMYIPMLKPVCCLFALHLFKAIPSMNSGEAV